MIRMRIISENKCVEYSDDFPKNLPNGESVLFKIEKINRPKGVKDYEFEKCLVDVEQEINWAILERIKDEDDNDSEPLLKIKVRGLHALYPHFYFDVFRKEDKDFAFMADFFNMKPVDDLGIMLYPGNEDLNK